MPSSLTILCDVLEGWGAKMNADKREVLDQLISKGFVVPARTKGRLQETNLPTKLNKLLAERGVGISGG